MISLICGIYKKGTNGKKRRGYKKTYSQNRCRVADVGNKCNLPGDKRRGINWETGTDTYELLCTK